MEIADLREDLDQAHWELEECRRDTELNASRAKESAREEMKDRHLKEMSMKDEIISLLKEKLATERKNAGLSLGGGSSASESVEGDKEPPKVAEERTAKKMTLPTLQKFGGDGDAFDCWLRKFSHYADADWNSGQSDRSCYSWSCISQGEPSKCMKCSLQVQRTLFPEQSNH